MQLQKADEIRFILETRVYHISINVLLSIWLPKMLLSKWSKMASTMHRDDISRTCGPCGVGWGRGKEAF